MYLVITIIINFAEDFNRSFLELRLDLKSPELELKFPELKFPELELELELILSSGIGIGIEKNGIGIGIELKKRNWPQPWSRSITPQNNTDLNQGLLHLWSKFGDPSLNGWWVIARTSKSPTSSQKHQTKFTPYTHSPSSAQYHPQA